MIETELVFTGNLFSRSTPRQYNRWSVSLEEKGRYVLDTSNGPDREKISNLLIIIIIIFIWYLSRPNCHRHGIYIIISFCEKKDLDFNGWNLNSLETWKLSHEEQSSCSIQKEFDNQ